MAYRKKYLSREILGFRIHIYLCLRLQPSSVVNTSLIQGDMVAALVKGPEDENWILAEVVAYNSVTGKYDVDDIDEEQKDRHTLSKRLASTIDQQNVDPNCHRRSHRKLQFKS